MLRVYSYVVINRRAQMSPRAYIYRPTLIACCGYRPPRTSVAARIYMYVTARSCVYDVICCVVVLARSIHKSPRARAHVYSCVAIAISSLCRNHSMALCRNRPFFFSLCRNHSSALCRNRHVSLRCVAITSWRCVGIAIVIFPSVVSQSLFGVVSQSPMCFVSQSLSPNLKVLGPIPSEG